MSDRAKATGVPNAVLTIRDEIYRQLGPRRCLAWRQTGPDALGVLAYDVCGLAKRHGGFPHQAGWTGTGELWHDEADA